MAVQRQDGWANDARPGATDLTGKERLLVTRDSSNNIRLSQSGEIVAGVLQEGKAAGLWSSFATGGHPLKAIAGSAITVGQRVQAGSDGTVVPGTTNSVGVARNACFSGEMVEIMWDGV